VLVAALLVSSVMNVIITLVVIFLAKHIERAHRITSEAGGYDKVLIRVCDLSMLCFASFARNTSTHFVKVLRTSTPSTFNLFLLHRLSV